ncbi:MAG: hypothetical protein M0R70_00635 [Nitrospirae bacterium]|nr:hypothetical protein [Nitrospirota bacterium]
MKLISGRSESKSVRIAVLCILLVLIITSCSIQLISPYNAETQQATFRCASLVDRFYGTLLEADEQNRQYSKFSDQYVAIESELNGLVLRNKVRSLNQDSTDIAERIAKLWQKYKSRHKNDNTYSTGNAELDRDRLARMFGYAVRAEDAKKPNE